MKNEEMTYKVEYINTVDTLAGISEQLIIENKGDSVKIKANNENKTCMYMLEAPKEYFNFSNENLCILNWAKFSKYFNVFNNAAQKEETKIEVIINDEGEAEEPVELSLSSNKRPANINYRLGNIDVIRHPVIKDNPNFPAFVSKMKLSEDQIKEIMSMITLIESDQMIIKIGGKECEIEISNKMTKNKFSQKYALEDEYEGKLELSVLPEIFTLLPKTSYEIGYSEKGLIKFDQQRDDEISLQLYLVSTRK